jgi:hypothetical protein
MDDRTDGEYVVGITVVERTAKLDGLVGAVVEKEVADERLAARTTSGQIAFEIILFATAIESMKGFKMTQSNHQQGVIIVSFDQFSDQWVDTTKIKSMASSLVVAVRVAS